MNYQANLHLKSPSPVIPFPFYLYRYTLIPAYLQVIYCTCFYDHYPRYYIKTSFNRKLQSVIALDYLSAENPSVIFWHKENFLYPLDLPLNAILSMPFV